MSILETLIARGETRVAGFDLVPPKRLPKGVNIIKGSVCDFEAVKAACTGIDVVFTTAAAIRYYERLPWQYAASHAVNVTGTENVVRACIEAGVQVLIQTSTSNVCASIHVNLSQKLDENTPYVDPTNTPSHYGWTKVQAERTILTANASDLPNSRGKLLTGAIRPCSAIFGTDDVFLTEKWVNEQRVQLILPNPVCDFIYVENVVYGHFLLEKALLSNPTEAAGKPFCVSNMEPMSMDDFYSALAYFYEEHTGVKMTLYYMPVRLMWTIAYGVELFQRLIHYRPAPPLCNLTPAMLDTAGLNYAFSIDKARRVLGYEPLYTVDEALQRSVALRTDLPVKNGNSKNK